MTPSHLQPTIEPTHRRPIHTVARLLVLLLLSTLITATVPRMALASSASLRLPCAAAPTPNSVTCRLAGQGFHAGERFQIVYHLALSGSLSRLLSIRTGKTSAQGTFVRPPLGFEVPRNGQTYQVTATVSGTSHRATISVHGVYRSPVATGRRIVVSVSTQRLTAFEGQRQVLTTLVTTGNTRLTPTPLGRYTILARYSPYRFVSPWPYGHPYWYASAWSSYALSFRTDGYFIHDAPWRTVYGPASQGGGAPGSNYGGTHGCVNVPLPAARFLYSWAAPGTELLVVV